MSLTNSITYPSFMFHPLWWRVSFGDSFAGLYHHENEELSLPGFCLLHLPYRITFPSTTTATYCPSLRNCMTFLPPRANTAHRDSVSGFCSKPRISFPSKMKSPCRKPFRGVTRTEY